MLDLPITQSDSFTPETVLFSTWYARRRVLATSDGRVTSSEGRIDTWLQERAMASVSRFHEFNRAEREDIARDALIKLRAIMDSEDIMHLEALCSKVAFQTALDVRRKFKRRKELDSSKLPGVGETEQERVQRTAMKMAAADTLSWLLERTNHQTVQMFKMRYEAEMTVEEITTRLGICHRTVSSRLWRAKKLILANTKLCRQAAEVLGMTKT